MPEPAGSLLTRHAARSPVPKGGLWSQVQQQDSLGAGNYLMLPLRSLQKGHTGFCCMQFVVFSGVLMAEMFTADLLLWLATVSMRGNSTLL